MAAETHSFGLTRRDQGAIVRPGVPLARGAARLLQGLGYAPLTEFSLATGRRVDVFGVAKDGGMIAVEVKSSRQDFLSDGKWPDYLAFCDLFYFAVPEGFPDELLPLEHGMMRVDAYGGAILRPAAAAPVAAARRKALLARFARTAAERLRQFTDPEAAL